MKKLNLLATAAIFTLGITAAPAFADDNTKAADFARNATVAGMFEIQSSQLALTKSSDGEVKKFAQQMIADHTKAAADLKATYAAIGMDPATLPTALDKKHQEMLDKLNKDDAGKSFDTDYTDMQHKAHQEAVTLFRTYAEKGDNTTLTTFASRTLPTLKMHEDAASGLDAKF